MKQVLIVIVVLVIAGLAYWFFLMNQTVSTPYSGKTELVPPALPE